MLKAFAQTHICQTLQLSGIPSVFILSEFAFWFEFTKYKTWPSALGLYMQVQCGFYRTVV